MKSIICCLYSNFTQHKLSCKKKLRPTNAKHLESTSLQGSKDFKTKSLSQEFDDESSKEQSSAKNMQDPVDITDDKCSQCTYSNKSSFR